MYAMRSALVGVYTYGTVRTSKKKYMHSKNIPLPVRFALSIQPVLVTPFMLPVYVAEDSGLITDDANKK